MGSCLHNMALSPDHWTTFIDSICIGAVQHLTFNSVDFTALSNHAFLVAVRSRGLLSFAVERSIVPSSFVTDDLIRSCVAKGLLSLWFSKNKSNTPHALSEHAVLDFFFPADAASARQHRHLRLENLKVTDKFLINFFE
ncbi:hypothetical protein AAVH_29446, partial [Aphelenchoides avenae]